MYILCMTPSCHTHSLTNCLTHTFTLTHCASLLSSLHHSLTHSLHHSLTHSLHQSPIHSFPHSLSLSFSLPQSTDTQSSALHEAATAGSLECVQYLLGQGADRSALNCNGETPFDCSTQLEIRQCVGCLHVLCCFALFVCLTLLASFFLPSHLSFKNMYIHRVYIYMMYMYI